MTRTHDPISTRSLLHVWVLFLASLAALRMKNILTPGSSQLCTRTLWWPRSGASSPTPDSIQLMSMSSITPTLTSSQESTGITTTDSFALQRWPYSIVLAFIPWLKFESGWICPAQETAEHRGEMESDSQWCCLVWPDCPSGVVSQCWPELSPPASLL